MARRPPDPLSEAYHAATQQVVDPVKQRARLRWDTLMSQSVTQESLNLFLDTTEPEVAAMKKIVSYLTTVYVASRANSPRSPVGDTSEQRGISFSDEFARPFVQMRTLISQGRSTEDALRITGDRIEIMLDTDAQMAHVRQARDSLEFAGVERYMRVAAGPNPCPLCLLASTQVYYTEDLMPIHERCYCIVEPLNTDWIHKDSDTGRSYVLPPSMEIPEAYTQIGPRGGNADYAYYFEQMDKRLTAANAARALENVVAVSNHNEIGPMLEYAKRIERPANISVETEKLTGVRKINSYIKEVEGYGLTEENSRVRRAFNSAYPGDHAFMARDEQRHIVGVALVEVSGRGKYKEYALHEFFKDDSAPAKTGSTLLQEVAKAAKADNAELTVRGAVGTARTYYEQMGGDFGGFMQPSGQLTSQSSTARWSTEARDALAAGEPIPAPHYLVEGPRGPSGEITWVEPPNPKAAELGDIAIARAARTPVITEDMYFVDAFDSFQQAHPTVSLDTFLGKEAKGRYASTILERISDSGAASGIFRDALDGFDEVLQKYPMMKPGFISIGFDNELMAGREAFAATEAVLGPAGDSRVYFERNAYAAPNLFIKDFNKAVGEGHFNADPDTRPGYYIAVHEMGHALVNYAGDPIGDSDLDKLARKVFFDENPGMEQRAKLRDPTWQDEFWEWAHKGTSEYAFTTEGVFNTPEAIAEAFADVTLHGEQASSLNRAIVDKLEYWVGIQAELEGYGVA